MSETPDDKAADVLIEAMERLSAEFDTLCQERYNAGAEEYGQFTFLSNDVVRMLAEELADTANYARMQYVKLMLLQAFIEDQLLENDLADQDGNITIGVKSFKGTGEHGWKR